MIINPPLQHTPKRFTIQSLEQESIIRLRKMINARPGIALLFENYISHYLIIPNSSSNSPLRSLEKRKSIQNSLSVSLHSFSATFYVVQTIYRAILDITRRILIYLIRYSERVIRNLSFPCFCIFSFLGFQLFSFDYSQLELRVLAYLSNDLKLKTRLENDYDFFISLAADLLKKQEYEITPEQRQNAKQVKRHYLHDSFRILSIL